MNLDSIPHSCAHWCSSLSERTVFLPYFSHYIFQSPLGKVIKRELPIFFHTWKCTRTPEWWKCSVVKRGQCWLHSVSRSVVSTFIHVAYSQFLLSFTKTDVPSILFFLMARLLSCPSCASVLRVRYCGLRNHRSHGKRPQLPKVPSLKPGGGQNIALYALPTDGKILPSHSIWHCFLPTCGCSWWLRFSASCLPACQVTDTAVDSGFCLCVLLLVTSVEHCEFHLLIHFLLVPFQQKEVCVLNSRLEW